MVDSFRQSLFVCFPCAFCWRKQMAWPSATNVLSHRIAVNAVGSWRTYARGSFHARGTHTTNKRTQSRRCGCVFAQPAAARPVVRDTARFSYVCSVCVLPRNAEMWFTWNGWMRKYMRAYFITDATDVRLSVLCSLLAMISWCLHNCGPLVHSRSWESSSQKMLASVVSRRSCSFPRKCLFATKANDNANIMMMLCEMRFHLRLNVRTYWYKLPLRKLWFD